MPFEVLSTPTVATLPDDIVLQPLGPHMVEAQANVDASGGALSIDADALTLTYTDADGNDVVATVVLPPEYELFGTQGVVFGADMSKFLVPLVEFGPDENNFDAPFGLLEVSIDAAGAIVVSEVIEVETNANTAADPFELYPLGDGRVGYVIGAAGGDNTGEMGVFSDHEDGIDKTYLGGANEQDETFYAIATADGGLLSVTVDALNSDQVVVTQYAADGTLLAAGSVSGPFVAGAGDGPSPQATLLLDENGELEVYFTTDLLPEGGVGEDVETYRTVFDLLPIAEEPVIEPPLPPVDDVIPTEDDDILKLTSGDDIIDALGGDDLVRGLGGKDWIIGGDGNDSIDGGRGDDALMSDTVVDHSALEGEPGGLYGGAGDDSINGRMGSDWIDGGDGSDDLRGGAGNDSTDYENFDGTQAGLFGGDGDDFIRGNRGNDDLRGGAGNDDLNGGFGDDEVRGDDGDDKVSGYDGSDFLSGGNGADVLHGGRGDDTMSGGAGDDILRGAEGADTLQGDEGDDVLIGGAGADVFSYIVGGRTVAGEDITEPADNGTDTIKDFTSGEDKIEIASYYTDGDGSETVPPITFDDLFLSQEDSVAVIEAGDTTIRLKGVDVDDLSEDDFIII